MDRLKKVQADAWIIKLMDHGLLQNEPQNINLGNQYLRHGSIGVLIVDAMQIH